MTELLDPIITPVDGYGAVHFGAYDIITALNIRRDKIEYVDTKISQEQTKTE